MKLNSLQYTEGSRKVSKREGRGQAQALEKMAVMVIKVKTQEVVAELAQASKVDKTQFTEDYQREDLTTSVELNSQQLMYAI